MTTINYVQTFLDKTQPLDRVLGILEDSTTTPIAQVKWNADEKCLYLRMLITVGTVSWVGTFNAEGMDYGLYVGSAVGLEDELIHCGRRVENGIASSNHISNCSLTLNEGNVLTFDANIIKINSNDYQIMLKADNIKRFDG